MFYLFKFFLVLALQRPSPKDKIDINESIQCFSLQIDHNAAYFFELVLSSAAFKPFANFPGSSTPQK
jgi:hypothetical protein